MHEVISPGLRVPTLFIGVVLANKSFNEIDPCKENRGMVYPTALSMRFGDLSPIGPLVFGQAASEGVAGCNAAKFEDGTSIKGSTIKLESSTLPVHEIIESERHILRNSQAQ